MFPDKERYDDALEKFEELYYSDKVDWLQEYLEFSRFIQGIFISKHGYIINTGNFQTCNLQLMHLVKKEIEEHPLRWSRFMIG